MEFTEHVSAAVTCTSVRFISDDMPGEMFKFWQMTLEITTGPS